MSRLLPDLKQQIIRDNTQVFLTPDSFAEKMELEYQGKSWSCWAQYEEEGTHLTLRTSLEFKHSFEPFETR